VTAALTVQDLEVLRRRLLGFCYQMLGSPFDAEDAVQDVMARAWSARSTFDSSRASVSTWCYRIAHNVCVDRLRDAARRPLPRDLREPGLEVGAPLVPALDVPWLMPAPTSWCQASDVESAAERTADIRLAVTAMLQALPPRQRGVFVLRDVIGCTAAETADVLAMTPSAVNSALQRARSALRETTGRERGLDPASVERYARAIETADLDELATLVADDVVLEMPPVPSWSRGKEPYLAFMAQLFAWRGTRWETRPILANSQPAMLLYRLTKEGPEAHTVQLFDAGDSGRIGHVLVYQDARLFELFEKSI
jgi:RNA polymerase sigma-70 factor (ECF subfamily)